MITAENFKEKFFDEEKHIKDFVEKKLSEVLKAFEDSHVNDECSFTMLDHGRLKPKVFLPLGFFHFVSLLFENICYIIISTTTLNEIKKFGRV